MPVDPVVHENQTIEVEQMTKGAELNGLLGQNADFEGELSCTGDIMLEGRFKGKLSVRGTLFIGEGAEIEADVHAAGVVIAGRFRGNIVADEKIEFSRPGKFYGNIQAPAIVIDEGARFEGNCRVSGCRSPEVFSGNRFRI